MNLKSKIFLENQSKAAETRLAAQLAFLKEKGLEGAAVQRDPLIRKRKAEIRKAKYRLACIAAQEKLNAQKAQTKEDKSAQKKSGREKPPAEAAKVPSGKKAKKEKVKEASPAAKEEA